MKPSDSNTLLNPSPSLFFPSLGVASKEDLFATLVDALAEQGIAQNRNALLKALLEREAVGTTGVGFGIAIPHARSMVVAATALVFARLPNGLDFAARDEAPVQVVFLIVAPYGAAGTLYLPLLAVLTAASRRKPTRHRLLAVESFDDYAKLINKLIKPQLVEVLAR